MSENEFLEYIIAICKRPKMYTATASFYETISYLDGFAAGANVGENLHHSKFVPFHLWLVKKFGRNDIIINWNDYREMFDSEIEALKNLPILYKEYVESL
jgi:hypothetical protein